MANQQAGDRARDPLVIVNGALRRKSDPRRFEKRRALNPPRVCYWLAAQYPCGFPEGMPGKPRLVRVAGLHRACQRVFARGEYGFLRGVRRHPTFKDIAPPRIVIAWNRTIEVDAHTIELLLPVDGERLLALVG